MDKVLKNKRKAKQPNDGLNHNFQRFFLHPRVAHHKCHSYGKGYLKAVKKYGNNSEYYINPKVCILTPQRACNQNLVQQCDTKTKNYEGNQCQVRLKLESANQRVHLVPIFLVSKHLKLLNEWQMLGCLTFF